MTIRDEYNSAVKHLRELEEKARAGLANKNLADVLSETAHRLEVTLTHPDWNFLEDGEHNPANQAGRNDDGTLKEGYHDVDGRAVLRDDYVMNDDGSVVRRPPGFGAPISGGPGLAASENYVNRTEQSADDAANAKPPVPTPYEGEKPQPGDDQRPRIAAEENARAETQVANAANGAPVQQ